MEENKFTNKKKKIFIILAIVILLFGAFLIVESLNMDGLAKGGVFSIGIHIVLLGIAVLLNELIKNWKIKIVILLVAISIYIYLLIDYYSI